MAKHDKPMAVAMEKMPTTIHLDEEELPEIKDWKVGQKYTIQMEVEQTGLHKGGMLDENKKYSADFKVLKVSVPGEDTPEEEAKESPEVESKEDKGAKIAQAVRRKFNK